MEMKEIWERACALMESEMNRIVYTTWIANNLTVIALEEDNLILPAPGAENFRSEMIDGRWMVDAHTVEVTFDRILGWPIRINIDHGTQTVTVCAE